VVVEAFVYAGAFLFSLGITGLFVWRSLDDLIMEIRPLSHMAISSSMPCPRCRKKLALGDAKCARCRLNLSYHNVRATAANQAFAIAEQLNFGHYIEWSIDTAEGQQLKIVAPVGPVVRAGDRLDLVFDGRRRLRALHNQTLGTGWRLPVRVVGQRSPFAVLGLLVLVPVITLLIFAAPIYFLFQSLEHAFGAASHVLASGADRAPSPNFGTGEIAALILYLVAVGVFAGLITLLRTRPGINRQVFRP